MAMVRYKLVSARFQFFPILCNWLSLPLPCASGAFFFAAVAKGRGRLRCLLCCFEEHPRSTRCVSRPIFPPSSFNSVWLALPPQQQQSRQQQRAVPSQQRWSCCEHAPGGSVRRGKAELFAEQFFEQGQHEPHAVEVRVAREKAPGRAAEIALVARSCRSRRKVTLLSY